MENLEFIGKESPYPVFQLPAEGYLRHHEEYIPSCVQDLPGQFHINLGLSGTCHAVKKCGLAVFESLFDL